MSATLQIANNGSSTLAAPITNGSATCTLAAGTGALFPALASGQYFVASFTDAATRTVREIVHVVAVSGDTMTLVRGQEGTAALAWQENDLFALQVTAGLLQSLSPLVLANVTGNGVTSDTATMNAAITYATAQPSGGAFIVLPPGKTLTLPTTPGYTGNNVWFMNGAQYGGLPYHATGADLNINLIQGGIAFKRDQSLVSNNPMLNIIGTTTTSAVASGDTISLVNVSHTIASGATTGIPYTMSIQTILNASNATSNSCLNLNMQKNVVQAAPIVLAIQTKDNTGSNSSVAGAIGVAEFDVYATGLDNGGVVVGQFPAGRLRYGINIVFQDTGTQGNPTEYGNAFLVKCAVSSGNPYTYVKTPFAMAGTVSAAVFDASSALLLSGADAFRMTAGSTIGFDGVATNNNTPTPHTLSYNATASEFQFSNNLTPALRIGSAGGVGFFGSTAPTSKPVIAGSRGSATAAVLEALLQALATAGFLTDSTTA